MHLLEAPKEHGVTLADKALLVAIELGRGVHDSHHSTYAHAYWTYKYAADGLEIVVPQLRAWPHYAKDGPNYLRLLDRLWRDCPGRVVVDPEMLSQLQARTLDPTSVRISYGGKPVFFACGAKQVLAPGLWQDALHDIYQHAVREHAARKDAVYSTARRLLSADLGGLLACAVHVRQ